MKKFFLSKTSDIAANNARSFSLPDGIHIVLFHTKSSFYAVENRCPHAGAPLIDGRIKNDILTCVWHGWRFNLKTNECLTSSNAKLKIFPLSIEGGNIYLIKTME
jgi:nitrite reductase/ring-hydroxylating ferredoxin subunit